MNDAQVDLMEPPSAERTEPSGCAMLSSLSVWFGWVLLLTAMLQFLIWTLEQQIFTNSKAADVRWLFSLLYGLGIFVPAVALRLRAVGKEGGEVRPVSGLASRLYLAFALAGLYAIFLFPSRLAGIVNGYGTAALQILFSALFLLFVRLGLPRISQFANFAGESGQRVVWRGVGVALFAAVLMALPWLLWGALGSVEDTLLNLVAALLFGWAAGLVLEGIFWREPGSAERSGSLVWRGMAAALALLVMVTGLAANGNQGLLSTSVPPLAWAAAALSRQGRLRKGGSVSNRLVISLMLGLAAFWPLAFVDPDELAAILSATPGEAAQWANLASLAALLIAALLGVGLVAARKWLVGPRAPLMTSPLALIPGAVMAVIGLVLYFVVGQPGFFGERLFVVLKDQADLSPAIQITDYNQRRVFVYRTLVDRANASQAELRAALDNLGISYRAYYLENALEVHGGPLVRLWLENRAEVDHILDSPVLRPLPAELPISVGGLDVPPGVLWNLAEIQADRVWDDLGVRGSGIIIGQSDSGVQYDHPELADSYRGRNGQHDYNWYDPWNGTRIPIDISGHGTHTLGTALGNRVGIAPDAEWIGCTNLARNLGNPALYLDCMQFMLAPFPLDGDPLRDGQPERGAQILNNSWGCPEVEGCDPTALLPAVSALRAAGIFVVASAGNDGSDGCATVAEPISMYDAVYSVGAINQLGILADFSSKGPVEADGSGRVKPDIVAPGVGVLSAYPGSTYSAASGTSMASPHVAGVVALMWSANPGLIGDIDRTEQILNETAVRYTADLPTCVEIGQPNNGVGYGVLNAYRAVQRAMGE